MIWVSSIALAAICNAVMDKVENENFYTSIFRNLNPNFWYKRQSWDKARKIGGWKFDAWHVFKSLMLGFLTIAIVSYEELFAWYYDYAIAGGIWIFFFNLFYNRILKV